MSDAPLSEPSKWDETVEHYAAVGEAITGPYCLDALADLDLHPGVRLLDVATGTGALARAAAERGASVTAIDFSEGMVAYLARRSRAEDLPGLAARVMDGQALDLPDGSFDVACSAFGVILFPDHRAGLAEMRRVLVPGGSVRVMAWAAPERLAHLAIWEDAVRDAFPGFDDFVRPAGWLAMMAPEGLTAELRRAGFVEVEARLHRHAWTVPSADWLLAQQTDSNPFAVKLYERLGPGSRERVRGRLLERLKGEHGDGPFSLPSEAWLGLGKV